MYSEEGNSVILTMSREDYEYRIWRWQRMFHKWMEYSEGWLRARDFNIAIMRKRNPMSCFAVERRDRLNSGNPNQKEGQ